MIRGSIRVPLLLSFLVHAAIAGTLPHGPASIERPATSRALWVASPRTPGPHRAGRPRLQAEAPSNHPVSPGPSPALPSQGQIDSYLRMVRSRVEESTRGA